MRSYCCYKNLLTILWNSLTMESSIDRYLMCNVPSLNCDSDVFKVKYLGLKLIQLDGILQV